MNSIGSPGPEASREASGSTQSSGKWGPEFAGRLLDQWTYLNKVELDFFKLGKPRDNAFIEAFNSRLRQE